MPWNFFRRESSPKDKNRDGWKTINAHYEKENAADLKRRQEEIAQSGLKENYQGDLLGMQVFEGTVSMFDYRNLPPELYERALAHPHAIDNDEKTFWPAGSQPLKVRLILGRNMNLSSPYVTGRFLSEPVEENGTAFGNLYFTAQVDALNNIRYVFPPGMSDASTRPFELALGALLDQYKSMNQGKDQADHYPLTVLFAHGM